MNGTILRYWIINVGGKKEYIYTGRTSKGNVRKKTAFLSRREK
jgi:hypothetical protein